MERKTTVEIGKNVKGIIIFDIDCPWWKRNPLRIKTMKKKCEYQNVLADIGEYPHQLLAKFDDVHEAIRNCFPDEEKEKIISIWFGVKYK